MRDESTRAESEPAATDTTGSAARALARIAAARNLGATAAAELAEQLLSAAPTHAGTFAELSPDLDGDPMSVLRSFRRDVELALDGALGTVRSAMDALEGLAIGANRTENSVESLAVDTRPGHETRTNLWIHNATTQSSPLELRVGPLTDAYGGQLEGTVAFDPPVLGPLGPGESENAVICIRPAPSAVLGEYHGIVLASGAATLDPLHLRVSVQGDES